MAHPNIITRRSFLNRGFKVGCGAALAALVDFPLAMKQALAEGSIGLGGKKLLFIFLRGANDGLNSVVPVLDDAYYNMGTLAAPKLTRPDIGILRDPAVDYGRVGACGDLTRYADGLGTVARVSGDPTYAYARAIPVGNGFAGLHPALKFLAPVYNAGDLALVHRVGYPKQSRSHFDSQAYWETGNPNDKISKEGVFYRTIVESGLARVNALTGISIQSSLPLLLRGPEVAMTNLSSPTRYSLLGIPHPAGEGKMTNFVSSVAGLPGPDKMNRSLLAQQFKNVADTLAIFEQMDFSEEGNTFRDDVATDGDADWFDGNGGEGYFLFPTTNAKNGGWSRPGGMTRADKYVVPTSAYSFYGQLKAASLILNNTDAIIAGTDFGGFDTHNNQGGATGTHADLQKRIAWSLYALKKYFAIYGKGGPKAAPGAKVGWNDLVIVTLSEFGRTTIQNDNDGTDHAEAGVMFVAGGAVRGYGKGSASGLFGCSPGDAVPWATGPSGSMFGVSGRYLKRCVDYRSVMGEIVRDHLGATQGQLNRIIPGYANPGEVLAAGGTSAVDGTPIQGEVGLV